MGFFSLQASAAALNLTTKFYAGTLAANLLSYATTSLAVLDPQTANNHPAINWCAIIAALSKTDLDTADLGNSLANVQLAIEAVYRMCWWMDEASDGITNWVTTSQSTAIFNAYAVFT